MGSRGAGVWVLASQGNQVTAANHQWQRLQAGIFLSWASQRSLLPLRWDLAQSPHGCELLKAKFCGLLNEIPVVAASTLHLYFRFDRKIFLPPPPPPLWICGFYLVSLQILDDTHWGPGTPQGKTRIPKSVGVAED